MNKRIVITCVGVIGLLCLAVAAKRAAVPAVVDNRSSAPVPVQKLVVHEWGTFTGIAGSDGVHLSYNTLVGSDLPAFVTNRQAQALHDDRKDTVGMLFLKGGGQSALVRMETPVIYFYADSLIDVNVRVDFPQGSLTEFYPPVRHMGPKYGWGFGEPMNPNPKVLAKGTGAAQTQPSESFLDWGRVRIVPHPTAGDEKLILPITGETHYALARDTDSAQLQFTATDGARHDEKFLFYRGLGNFALPVTLTAQDHAHFHLQNASSSPIASAFLIQIDNNGQKCTRFARFENLAGDQPLTFPSTLSSSAELSESIVRSLVSAGLYEKEARAMVATWKSTWLDEPGTRVLYLVPRTVTDSLLPLHINPAPSQVVRVLVGRIDIFTPEREARLLAMMTAAAKSGTISAEDAAMLINLGRFQTPAIVRTSQLADDVDHHLARALYEALAAAKEKGK